MYSDREPEELGYMHHSHADFMQRYVDEHKIIAIFRDNSPVTSALYEATRAFTSQEKSNWKALLELPGSPKMRRGSASILDGTEGTSTGKPFSVKIKSAMGKLQGYVSAYLSDSKKEYSESEIAYYEAFLKEKKDNGEITEVPLIHEEYNCLLQYRDREGNTAYIAKGQEIIDYDPEAFRDLNLNPDAFYKMDGEVKKQDTLAVFSERIPKLIEVTDIALYTKNLVLGDSEGKIFIPDYDLLTLAGKKIGAASSPTIPAVVGDYGIVTEFEMEHIQGLKSGAGMRDMVQHGCGCRNPHPEDIVASPETPYNFFAPGKELELITSEERLIEVYNEYRGKGYYMHVNPQWGWEISKNGDIKKPSDRKKYPFKAVHEAIDNLPENQMDSAEEILNKFIEVRDLEFQKAFYDCHIGHCSRRRKKGVTKRYAGDIDELREAISEKQAELEGLEERYNERFGEESPCKKAEKGKLREEKSWVERLAEKENGKGKGIERE